VAFRFSRLDVLLLLMTIIWGTNFSIVKHAFARVDPQAFNAIRMLIASAVFLVLIAVIRRARRRPPVRAEGVDAASFVSIFHTPARITRADWVRLAALGVVGHFLYQYLFIGGLARTSVANSSLILAATPVVIALASAPFGHDRVSPLHWAGAVLSMLGIYVVVGRGMTLGTHGFKGDLMMVGAVGCWAAYTLGARGLMTRHSPVGVTGLSIAIGTLLYVPVVWPHVRATEWSAVGATVWLAMIYSALFALCIAYTIWYAAVREIGSARTAVYSNLVPLVAMGTAVAFLGEPLSPSKLVGAAAVLAGVALTRVPATTLATSAPEP
jgi:drug/metabolite transporter (DMT)-like permease